MLKKVEIISELQKKVKEIFDSTQYVKIKDKLPEVVKRRLAAQSIQMDLIVQAEIKDRKTYFLIFEIISMGQPRYVRMAVNQLQTIKASGREYYGVLGASYVSEESKQICLDAGIGFLDLSGNCFFQFDNVYIDIKGNPNPYPNRRPLKALFSQKSTRAIRVLLCHSNKVWTVKDLSIESSISIGHASNIKKRLLEYEYIDEVKAQRGVSFKLKNPETLLKKWAEMYTYKMNRAKNYYSLDSVKDIEEKIARYCDLNNIQYAFTLTSGSALVSPALRYNVVFVYILNSIETLAHSLNLKIVSTGSNVNLLEPYDAGVLYGAQEINGEKVVSDIQLYLDLQSYSGRGDEAAKSLFDNRLKIKW
jgi:hypothetical protein